MMSIRRRTSPWNSNFSAILRSILHAIDLASLSTSKIPKEYLRLAYPHTHTHHNSLDPEPIYSSKLSNGWFQVSNTKINVVTVPKIVVFIVRGRFLQYWAPLFRHDVQLMLTTIFRTSKQTTTTTTSTSTTITTPPKVITHFINFRETTTTLTMGATGTPLKNFWRCCRMYLHHLTRFASLLDLFKIGTNRPWIDISRLKHGQQPHCPVSPIVVS